MTEIVSRSNDRVKALARLVSSAAERRERGLFVADGIKLVRELYEAGATVRECWFTASALENEPLLAKMGEAVLMSESVSEKLGFSDTPQGALALCEIPKSAPLTDTGFALALDGIQDPGNVGAVIRCAAAFGADGVLLSRSCADPYSPKALRGSMGNIMRTKVTVCGLAETLCGCRERGVRIIAADMNGERLSPSLLEKPFIAVIGSEGSGISDEVRALCTGSISIPMQNGVESLNAAVSAALIAWEASK